MRLYNSYIIKAILVPLITLALIIISIVWILQTVKLLYLIDKGVAFVEFLKITSLAIPALTFMTLPFVTISAVVYAYYGLTRERQLIILRSLGLSNIQLAYPAIIVSFLVCCFASYLGFYLVPYSYGKLKRELDSAKNHFISSAITPSSFNQIAKNLTIYVGEKLSSNRFNEIILFDHRELKSKPSVIFAKSGYLHKTENGIVLILKHGTKQAFDKEDNFNKLMFGSVSLELKNISRLMK
jgi:lipopolysaccharide export system permease protein